MSSSLKNDTKNKGSFGGQVDVIGSRSPLAGSHPSTYETAREVSEQSLTFDSDSSLENTKVREAPTETLFRDCLAEPSSHNSDKSKEVSEILAPLKAFINGPINVEECPKESDVKAAETYQAEDDSEEEPSIFDAHYSEKEANFKLLGDASGPSDQSKSIPVMPLIASAVDVNDTDTHNRIKPCDRVFSSDIEGDFANVITTSIAPSSLSSKPSSTSNSVNNVHKNFPVCPDL